MKFPAVIGAAFLFASAFAADLPFAWDSPTNNPPAVFLLIGPLQTVSTTNKTAIASNVPPGQHEFTAAATNGAGGATSAPIVVRVVKMGLESADAPGGPWRSASNWFHAYTVGPSNGFLRMRLDWE